MPEHLYTGRWRVAFTSPDATSGRVWVNDFPLPDVVAVCLAARTGHAEGKVYLGIEVRPAQLELEGVADEGTAVQAKEVKERPKLLDDWTY